MENVCSEIHHCGFPLEYNKISLHLFIEMDIGPQALYFLIRVEDKFNNVYADMFQLSIRYTFDNEKVVVVVIEEYFTLK